MDEHRIQIIEMLRNIYELNNKESLEIYNKIIKNKNTEEIKIIFNNLLEAISKKNEILKKLSNNLTKIINTHKEKIEKENELKNFNI